MAASRGRAGPRRAFAQATRENRFVLLDLGAVWCHWCHVMERDTYGNPAVADLIRARYVPVRVDQDARPDLSRRYEDYGWPATVVFSADGREIVKLRGYVPAARMIAVLEHILADPSPITYQDSLFDELDARLRWEGHRALSEPVRSALERRYLATHDARRGGLLQSHKYLDWNTVEYGLLRARPGRRHGQANGPADPRGLPQPDRPGLGRRLPVLHARRSGGTSTSRRSCRCRPNIYESMRSPEPDSMTLAYLPCGTRRSTDTLRTFLRSPEGAFYVSQDADVVKGQHAEAYFALGDAARRRQGIPAVDRHLYARENGWMIAALATLHAATGERTYLDDALAATRWVLDHRALPEGGFRHDAADAGGPTWTTRWRWVVPFSRSMRQRRSANGWPGPKLRRASSDTRSGTEHGRAT